MSWRISSWTQANSHQNAFSVKLPSTWWCCPHTKLNPNATNGVPSENKSKSLPTLPLQPTRNQLNILKKEIVAVFALVVVLLVQRARKVVNRLQKTVLFLVLLFRK